MRGRDIARPFPFEVTDEYGSTLTDYYPFQAPITKLAEWFWRVRAFEISEDINGDTLTAGAEGLFTASRTPGILANEHDLYMRRREFAFHDSILVGPEEYVNATLDLMTPFTAEGSRRNALFDSWDSCSPLFFLNWNTTDVSDRTHHFTINSGTFSAGVPGFAECSIVFDGFPIVAYYSTSTGSPAPTVTITPVEWWPWARRDGTEPIWDSATGEKLRDHRQDKV